MAVTARRGSVAVTARLSDLKRIDLIALFECRCRSEQLVPSLLVIDCESFGAFVALLVVVDQRATHRIGDRTVRVREFIEPILRDHAPLPEFCRCQFVLLGDSAQLVRLDNQSFGHARLIPPAS